MYLDSAYLAKFYVNEPDSAAVRKRMRLAPYICTSSWAVLEVVCAFRRHVRERALTNSQEREVMELFRAHVEDHVWNLIPVTDALLRKTATMVRGLPSNVLLRAGDAIHLATALDTGEAEVWTNDRHLLAAAAHFGLAGKSVTT